jgi:hypothetical protein
MRRLSFIQHATNPLIRLVASSNKVQPIHLLFTGEKNFPPVTLLVSRIPLPNCAIKTYRARDRVPLMLHTI